MMGDIYAHTGSHANIAKEQLEKSPRHGEWVKITTESGREVSAFIVFPEVKEKAASVIVIHEIFGLTDWIRQVGDELAKAGFVAICPDFLSGMGPNGGGTDSFEGNSVRRAIGDLDPDQITADLKAVAKYVRDLPSTTDVVAVSGFCWGGRQSFRFCHQRQFTKSGVRFLWQPPGCSGIRERLPVLSTVFTVRVITESTRLLSQRRKLQNLPVSPMSL